MNRQDISGLQKNRAIYFKLAMIITLSLVLFAFNWTSDYSIADNRVRMEPLEEEAPIPITRWQEEKRILPPPVIKATIDPVLEDFVINEDPVPEKIETAIKDLEIEKVELPTPDLTPVKLTPPPLPVVEEDLPDELFEVVEEMPRFPGCEEEGLSKKEKAACAEKAMLDYVYSIVKYPAMALENGIEGAAVVSFIIEKDGAISSLEIIKEIGGGCGREVKRVINTMPNWIPGKQRDRPVRVKYKLPVVFKIR